MRLADRRAEETVFITETMEERAPKAADFRQEKQALQDLARQMVDRPGEFLPRLVDLAIEICDAVSGGISLYEELPAPGVFRWHYLRGDLSRFNGATTPRNFSPCGICLDENRPILVQRPERLYTWLVDADVSLPECLLVPLFVGGEEPLGTLWIVSQSEGHFDSGHARVAEELASFAGIALHMLRSEERLERALEQQETLARELNHRVKNIFAIANALIRFSARSATTPEEMARVLSERMGALASAHSLISRNFADLADAGSATDLEDLLRTIVRPHGAMAERDTGRFAIQGPALGIQEQAATALAMVFHELATNAAKYGALMVPEGAVEVSWRIEAERLLLRWRESGGPRLEGPPSREGFGSTLARNAIAGQLRGAVDHDWRPEGLVVDINLPMDSLSA